MTLSNLAWVHEDQGRHVEAIQLLEPAEHTARAVFTGDWARVFARMLMNLGRARRRARGPDRDVEVTVRV